MPFEPNTKIAVLRLNNQTSPGSQVYAIGSQEAAKIVKSRYSSSANNFCLLKENPPQEIIIFYWAKDLIKN